MHLNSTESVKGTSSKASMPPPSIDIKDKGNIYAPLRGTANTSFGEIGLKKDIHISNLAQGDTAASARAWLPAIELHYQFGKSGAISSVPMSVQG